MRLATRLAAFTIVAYMLGLAGVLLLASLMIYAEHGPIRVTLERARTIQQHH